MPRLGFPLAEDLQNSRNIGEHTYALVRVHLGGPKGGPKKKKPRK